MNTLAFLINVMILSACCAAYYGAYLLRQDGYSRMAGIDKVLLGAVLLATVGSGIDIFNYFK